MNNQTEQGVVLHSLKYSENQLVIHILTRLGGRRSFITKVSGRGNGRNLFQPLYLIDFIPVKSRGEIGKLSQVTASIPLYNIPYDIAKSSITLFIAEILYRLIKEENADERLFDFVQSSVIALDLAEGSVANFHLHFMVRLSHYLGFAPQGRYVNGNWFDIKSGAYETIEPKHDLKLDQFYTNLLNRLWNCSVSDIASIELNRGQRTDFLEQMVTLYGYHTESVYSVNSISIFREIF